MTITQILIITGVIILGLLALFCVLGLGVFIFYFLRSIVRIEDDEVGLIYKKYSLSPNHQKLEAGQRIATNGEPGWQAHTLAPGTYYGYWAWVYKIEKVPRAVIPPGQIGLVKANDGTAIPLERLLGKHVECDNFQDGEAFLKNGGEQGRQIDILVNGTYQINTKLFDVITMENAHEYELKPGGLAIYRVERDRIGIVTTFDGTPIPTNNIAGPTVQGHNSFQDGHKFIEVGGYRGLQEEILKTGAYRLNPWLVSVIQQPLVEIPAGTVGVVISNIGEKLDEETEIKLAESGYKGIQVEPLYPGRHAINTEVMRIIIVPTNPIALDWSEKEKSDDNYDAGLGLLELRSKDGFPFEIEITQVIQIDGKDAPKMIAKIGVDEFNNSLAKDNVQNKQRYPAIKSLIKKVLEPTIGNYFRNSAQGYKALEFHAERINLQLQAKDYIDNALESHGVQGIDTLINEIDLPDDLEELLQSDAIIKQQKQNYIAQQAAEKERQRLERTKTDFEIKQQQKLAKLALEDAEFKAKALQFNHQADAEKLRLELEARANALRVEIEALGPEAYARIKEAAERAKIVLPQTMFGGSGSSGDFTQILMARMMGIDMGLPQQQKHVTGDQIEIFIEALGGYLQAGGAERVRSLFTELADTTPQLPASSE